MMRKMVYIVKCDVDALGSLCVHCRIRLIVFIVNAWYVETCR